MAAVQRSPARRAAARPALLRAPTRPPARPSSGPAPPAYTHPPATHPTPPALQLLPGGVHLVSGLSVRVSGVEPVGAHLRDSHRTTQLDPQVLNVGLGVPGVHGLWGTGAGDGTWVQEKGRGCRRGPSRSRARLSARKAGRWRMGRGTGRSRQVLARVVLGGGRADSMQWQGRSHVCVGCYERVALPPHPGRHSAHSCRYIMWMHATPAMLYAMGMLSDLRCAAQRSSMPACLHWPAAPALGSRAVGCASTKAQLAALTFPTPRR